MKYKLLVTCATGDIGTALCLFLAAQGHDLVITARKIDRLEKLAGQVVALYIDFNDVLIARGVSGVVEVLNQAVKPETFQEKLHEISMTDAQIKESIEGIARESRLDVFSIKSVAIAKKKTLQRVEMEIG